MARLFVPASSQRFLEARAPIVAEPLTIAAWMRRNAGGSGAIASIGNAAGSARWHFGIDGTNRAVAVAANASNTTGIAQAGTTTASSWQHIGAVFRSSTSRTAYLDGVPGSANTTSITVSGVDSLRVGARIVSGAEGFFWPGDLDHLALWDDDLADAEMDLLAHGASALRVRRKHLRRYWVLEGRGRYIRDLVTGALLEPSTSRPDPSTFVRNIFMPASARQLVVPALSAAASTHEVAVALGASIAATASATGARVATVALTQAVSVATAAVRSTLADLSLSTAAQIAATTGSLVQAVASLSVTSSMSTARTVSIESALGLTANAAVATSVLANMFGATALQSGVQLVPAGSMAASANLALQAIAAVSTLAGSSVSGSVSLDVHPVVLPDGSLGVVAAIPGLIRITATDSGLRVTAGSDSIKVH